MPESRATLIGGECIAVGRFLWDLCGKNSRMCGLVRGGCTFENGVYTEKILWTLPDMKRFGKKRAVYNVTFEDGRTVRIQGKLAGKIPVGEVWKSRIERILRSRPNRQRGAVRSIRDGSSGFGSGFSGRPARTADFLSGEKRFRVSEPDRPICRSACADGIRGETERSGRPVRGKRDGACPVPCFFRLLAVFLNASTPKKTILCESYLPPN